MSRRFGAAKAKRVLAALLEIGWTIKRTSGSHRVLAREGWTDYVFAFHDSEEIGPRMLARIARASVPPFLPVPVRARVRRVMGRRGHALSTGNFDNLFQIAQHTP